MGGFRVNATELGQPDGLQIESRVSLADLSELSGFPTDYIKRELAIDTDDVNLKDLREVMISYLKDTFGDLEEESSFSISN